MFSCRRTKTAAITGKLKSPLLSIMLGGSNGTGIEEMFPVTVRVFDVNLNRIMAKFLDMNIMKGEDVSTTESMSKSVEDIFTKFGLKWDSVTATGVDNTNSNIGHRNSLTSTAKDKK